MIMEYSDKIKNDGLAKSPHSVILRSEATKNLNDIRFFAIAQNDKGVFSRLFTSSSKMHNETIEEDVKGCAALGNSGDTILGNSWDTILNFSK